MKFTRFQNIINTNRNRMIKLFNTKNINDPNYVTNINNIDGTHKNEILKNACKCIIEDLKIEEQNDKYNRKIVYDPEEDLIKIMENTYPLRLEEKDSIQLLTDIHLFKWCEVNDSDWVIIS